MFFSIKELIFNCFSGVRQVPDPHFFYNSSYIKRTFYPGIGVRVLGDGENYPTISLDNHTGKYFVLCSVSAYY